MLSSITRTVFSTIPLAFFPYIVPRDVIGVFYHAVSDEPMPHVKHLYPPISVAAFEDSLLYLKKHYTLVDTNQIFAHYMQSKPLPRNAAFVSFDDGFVECFSVVRPLLLKHKIPCTFFLPTDFIDNKNLLFLSKASLAIDLLVNCSQSQARELLAKVKDLTGISMDTPDAFTKWILFLKKIDDETLVDQVCEIFGVKIQKFLDEKNPFLSRTQIKQMVNEGFVFGAHTKSHIKLNQLSVEDMEQEIVGSARIVKEITGQVQVSFSFPFSAKDIDREILKGVHDKHPDLFGLFYNTAGLVQDAEFIINRIWTEGKGFEPTNGKTNLPKLIRQSYRNAIYLARSRNK